MKVEVIVLNYNGGELLLECIPSLLNAVKKSRHEARLVILDNVSTDGSDQEAKKRFPGLRVVRAESNRILCSYNDYLESSDSDIAILLNNDIKADEGFIDPLVEPFETRSDVFLAAPQARSFDGTHYDGGRSQNRIRYGIFWSSSFFPGYEKGAKVPGVTMASGFGAFDRKKFLELGGYDALYLPGRLEDADICFRAWRRGWKCLYEPKSLVYHKGAVSFNKAFGVNGTLILGHRNSFLFFWKNMRDPWFWLEHFIFLLPRLAYAWLSGKKELALGFFEACKRSRSVCERRRAVSGERSVLSDREIFRQVN